jgi:hypothetical protein
MSPLRLRRAEIGMRQLPRPPARKMGLIQEIYLGAVMAGQRWGGRTRNWSAGLMSCSAQPKFALYRRNKFPCRFSIQLSPYTVK